MRRCGPYDPGMPETAPQRSTTARDLVTARIAGRAKQFPRLFPEALRTDGLDTRDTALAHAIDQAVARRWLTLVAVLRAKLNRPWDRLHPSVQAPLLVGAAQLLLMERIPDHAAINEAVNWTKPRQPRAAGMVNAVLRRVARLREKTDRVSFSLPAAGEEKETRSVFSRNELPLHDGRVLRLCEGVFDEDPLKRLAQQTSHPPELLARWVERYGFEQAARLAEHGLIRPPIIVSGADPLPGPPLCEPHDEPGFAVFTGDRAALVPLLAEYPTLRVQDPGSAAAVTATAEQVPNLIVELCAGKGTQTRQLTAIHPQALIIASDANPQKLAVLRDDFAGHDRVRVVEPAGLIDHAGQADLVIVDVPCSNTGVLARRVEARYRCTDEILTELWDLQRQILVDAVRLTTPQGRILYCTCSIEPQENTEQVRRLVKWHKARVQYQRHLLPAGRPGDPVSGYRDGGYFAILQLP